MQLYSHYIWNSDCYMTTDFTIYFYDKQKCTIYRIIINVHQYISRNKDYF